MLWSSNLLLPKLKQVERKWQCEFGWIIYPRDGRRAVREGGGVCTAKIACDQRLKQTVLANDKRNRKQTRQGCLPSVPGVESMHTNAFLWGGGERGHRVEGVGCLPSNYLPQIKTRLLPCLLGVPPPPLLENWKKPPKRNIICSSNNKRNRFTMSNMHARQLPLSLSICKGVNYISLSVCVCSCWPPLDSESFIYGKRRPRLDSPRTQRCGLHKTYLKDASR